MVKAYAVIGANYGDEGKGKVIVEGVTKELLPGMINVCKENHAHSVINDSTEDLVIIGIVTKGA